MSSTFATAKPSLCHTCSINLACCFFWLLSFSLHECHFSICFHHFLESSLEFLFHFLHSCPVFLLVLFPHLQNLAGGQVDVCLLVGSDGLDLMVGQTQFPSQVLQFWVTGDVSGDGQQTNIWNQARMSSNERVDVANSFSSSFFSNGDGCFVLWFLLWAWSHYFFAWMFLLQILFWSDETWEKKVVKCNGHTHLLLIRRAASRRFLRSCRFHRLFWLLSQKLLHQLQVQRRLAASRICNTSSLWGQFERRKKSFYRDEGTGVVWNFGIGKYQNSSDNS